MIPKRRLLINALMSVVQVIVVGVSLFVLYRFIADRIGMDRLGIFSLVLAIQNVSLPCRASTVSFSIPPKVTKSPAP